MKRVSMLTQFKVYLLLCVTTLVPFIVNAESRYAPARVVYDVTGSDATELSLLIDRVAYLQNIYQHNSFDASIILIVHDKAIPLFSKNNKSHRALMQRVNSLILGEVIQLRLCEASANMQGLNKDDFYHFVQLVPMADAEIIALQNSGYAYLK